MLIMTYLAFACTKSRILVLVFSLSLAYSSAISTLSGSLKSHRSVKIELMPNMTSFNRRVGSQLVPSIELSLRILKHTSPVATMRDLIKEDFLLSNLLAYMRY